MSAGPDHKKRRTDPGPALFDRGMFLDTVRQERGTADHQFLTRLLSSVNDQHIYRDEFDTMLSSVSLSGRLDLLRFLREVLKQLEQDELQMKQDELKMEQDELQMELQKKQEKSRSQAAVQLIDAISEEIPMNRTKDILEQFTHGVLRSAESLRVFLKSLGFPEHNITGSIALYFNEIPERHHLSVLAHYLTENEAHLMIPNHFLTDIPDIAGHFLANWMMIRSHYIHMADIALKHGDDQPILICGDPGIGKSLFSLYMFFRLVVEGQAVVRVSQGGAAIYYDPLMDHGTAFRFEPHFDKHKSDWLDARWWLLLDGRVLQIPFADKRKRAMAFASPQKKNYHEFIKDRGLTLFLPPWNDAEVETLVNGMSAQTILDLCAKWKALHGVVVDGNQREAFLNHLRERKKIVGGRIRLLLHPSKSLVDLKRMVELSASKFDEGIGAFTMHNLDITGDIPSLCYSIVPKCALETFNCEFHPFEGRENEESDVGAQDDQSQKQNAEKLGHGPAESSVTNKQETSLLKIGETEPDENDENPSVESLAPTDYMTMEVRFCSYKALQLAIRQFEVRTIMEKKRLFNLTCGTRAGGALAGHIFEIIAHTVLKRDTNKFQVQRLHYDKPTAGPIELQMKRAETPLGMTCTKDNQNIETRLNLCFKGDCVFERTVQVHKYSIPNSTFPDADSLIPPNVFFRMTVNMDHPFDAQRVLNCAKQYKWVYSDPIYFIYVVPKNHVDEYRYQIALTTKKTPLDKQPDNIQQYVLGIDADSLGDD